MYSPSVERLITELTRLPGIGPRSAQRLAFHILRQRPEQVLPLAEAIVEVKARIGFCRRCFNLAEGELCTVCADTRRDAGVVCVVEQPADIVPVERTGEFRGLYHVLGGALSPLDGVDPDDLHISELVARVDDSVREVILATNPTVEGETTALYLVKALKGTGVKVSRIAFGLPVGGDLEFADRQTLSRSFRGRTQIQG